MSRPFPRVVARRGLATSLACAGLLAACASAPPSTPPAAPPAAASATPTPATASPRAAAPSTAAEAPPNAAASSSGQAGPATPARPDPNALRPFAEVLRGAQRIDGFVPMWRKDDKVWLEIAPDRLDQPFLLSINVSSSLGERGLYASQMGPSWLVEFRRVGNTLQLIARNTGFRADGDPALQRAVAQGFSDSLLASTPVASATDAQRKAFVVDASFLLSDIVGYGMALERTFRIAYNLDRGNSTFEALRGDARLSVLQARLHYATPRLPPPPATPPPPGTAVPTPPSTLPDARSLFVGTVTSLMALPETPMRPRLADPRLGHFTTRFTDFSRDLPADSRVRYVNRWRLDKRDPEAPLSEPVQPIVFWIDRGVPARYRASVEAGVLAWNAAFERLGFRDAIVVRQQGDDASFDTMDSGHASIRWLVGADASAARGPSRGDPRTGEILDGDITISDGFARGARRVITEQVSHALADRRPDVAGHGSGMPSQDCSFAHDAAAQMHFALDLLEARGDIEPDSPEAEAFVQAVVRATVTHEVGHVLGLTHNFRASTAVPSAALRDRAFTEAHGLSGSVMDYNPFNLPLQGEPRSTLVQHGLGAYDFWAIEYAYRPLDPQAETVALEAIAARGVDPALAFGDDVDASGPDPRVNRFDLGDDPLAYYARRMQLARELWQRSIERGWRPGDDPLRLRRNLASGFRQLRDLPSLASKYVGGMYAERDRPGTGRAAYRPVEPARQREALRLLTTTLFEVGSFHFPPEFLASLPPDYAEFGSDRGGPVNVPQAVLQLQTASLDRLLDAGTAQRLLDLPAYLDERERRGAISLHEVYATLQSAVWQELKSGGDIEPLRRSLQREHLRRLQATLTRPPPTLPADALSLQRLLGQSLQRDLRRAAARPGLGVETRAHLNDSLALLEASLRASIVRAN